MKKKLNRSKLVKKLDAVFSQYVRLHYSNKNGICECYTCWEKLPRKKIQNGHFISRGNYKYRWDINNCRPQCMWCNIFKHGNYIEYTTRMIDEYGIDVINKMKSDKELIKISTPDIELLIDTYKDMVEQLEAKITLKKEKKSV